MRTVLQKLTVILAAVLLVSCGAIFNKRGRTVLSVAGGSSYDFSFQEVGSNPTALLTVRNAGEVDAKNLSSLGPVAPFTFTGGTFPGTAGTCGSTLAFSQTCLIDVTFSPIGVGSATSTFTIDYQSSGLSQSATFNLAGFGKVSGSLDTTFNTTGYSTITTGWAQPFVTQIAVDATGRILASGYQNLGIYTSFLARFLSDGTLDTSLLGAGWFSTCAFCVSDETLTNVLIQPDGRYVVSGRANDTVDNYNSFLRYNTDGSLDTTFNGTGIATYNILSNTTNASVIQPDGKVVQAGSAANQWSLMRINTDGSLDTSFNGTGYVTTPITTNDTLYSLVLQSDLSIAVAGATLDCCSNETTIGRYLPDGTLDTSFNTTGYNIFSYNPGIDQYNSILLQTDGKLVVVGSGNSGNADVITARYNTDGSLDTSYNGTGQRRFSMGYDTYGQAAALQPDGKIVIAGYTNNGSNQYYMARLNTDGSYDTTFATVGYVEFASGTSDVLTSISILSDGMYIIGGYTTIAATQYPVLLKVWY